MTETNLRHWNVLGKTDPAHTKSFTRAGGFKGTATRPIWTEMRLTDLFGPCGIGWGCDEPVFTLVSAGEEILVFCTLRCWYAENDRQASLYGVGGDKVLVKQQSGLRTDDEAYKKAFTDALGNAFKHLGAGADVHMGLFDDSKYVNEMKREFADDAPARPAEINKASVPPNPIEPPEVAEARDHVRELIAKYNRIIKTAPHRRALEMSLDDGRADFDAIEGAGAAGLEAARELRRRASIRLAQFDEAAAA